MDSTVHVDKSTCVLVLNEKSQPSKQYRVKPVNSSTGIDQIAKVIVRTETNRHIRRNEGKGANAKDQSDVSDGVDTYVPMLINTPKALGDCSPRGIFQGYVHTMKAIKILKEQYEVQTSSRFILYARSNAFGDGDWMEGKHRVAWEIAPNSKPGVSLPFQGIPFFIVGHAIYDCQHGRQRKPSKAPKREIGSPETLKKRKSSPQSSIKIGCPAQLLMREVIMFPEFKLAVDTLKRRQLMSQKVRKGIQLHNEGKDMVRTERRIYVYFPRQDEHHHRLNNINSNGTTRSVEPVDPMIVKKITSLVSQGVTGTKKIKEYVDDFVREMFQEGSPPPVDRRRYNPSDRDIRNTMKKAKVELKKVKRKKMELQCTSLMHGIREQLAAVKSEKYLMQLRDHLSHIHELVKKEESLEPFLEWTQTTKDTESKGPPHSNKAIKSEGSKEEVLDRTTEMMELPEQTISKTEYIEPDQVMFRTDYICSEAMQSQQPEKTLSLKPEQIGSLIELPGAPGPPSYTYSNEYENGEPNQIIYQEEVPHNQEAHMEGVTQIYYYQKIPSQGDLYTIPNQTDCNQVPYNITEFIKDPMDS